MAMNVSIELITGIALGVFLGLFIDNYLQTKPIMFIIFFIVGTIIGFYNMYKCLKNMGILSNINNMAADKGPLHQFEISNLYDIRLENVDISFTNSALSMVLLL